MSNTELFFSIQQRLQKIVGELESGEQNLLEQGNWDDVTSSIKEMMIAKSKIPEISKVLKKGWSLIPRNPQKVILTKRENAYGILKSFHAILSDQEKKLELTMEKIAESQVNTTKAIEMVGQFIQELEKDRQSVDDESSEAAIYDKFLATLNAMQTLDMTQLQKREIRSQEIASLFAEIALRKNAFRKMIPDYLKALFENTQIDQAVSSIEQMDTALEKLVKSTGEQDVNLADRTSKLSANSPITREMVEGQLQSLQESVDKIVTNLGEGKKANKDLLEFSQQVSKKLSIPLSEQFYQNFLLKE